MNGTECVLPRRPEYAASTVHIIFVYVQSNIPNFQSNNKLHSVHITSDSSPESDLGNSVCVLKLSH